MPKGQKVRVITPQQDEVIHKCWQHNGYGHHAQKRAAELTGLTESVCFRRAVQLGLVFTRERYRWTEPELQCVEQHCHLALDTIQKRLRLVSPAGVKRTRAAIAGQIHSQRFRTNLDGMNHGPLADALGISVQRLRGYRDEHLIAGQRLESLREACGYVEEIVDEHRHWFYHNDDIVRFLFSCHGQLDLAKVNQLWLMGLLEPYITLFQTTPEDRLQEERERTKLAQRRIRKQRTRKSIVSPRPSILGDAMVNAIRARSGRSKSPSNGETVSPPRRIPTGMSSQPIGSSSDVERTASGMGK
jgi:hypothetical protein